MLTKHRRQEYLDSLNTPLQTKRLALGKVMIKRDRPIDQTCHNPLIRSHTIPNKLLGHGECVKNMEHREVFLENILVQGRIPTDFTGDSPAYVHACTT